MNGVQGFIIGVGLMVIVYFMYMAWHHQEFHETYKKFDDDDEFDEDSEDDKMGVEEAEAKDWY